MVTAIDVRDLKSEFEELEEGREKYTEFLRTADTDISDNTKHAAMQLLGWEDEERWGELSSLLDVVPEDELTLILEDDWVEYCKELLEDIGELPKDLPSYIAIDWEATARNIAQDYSTVSYDGQEWYYRDV